MNTSSLRFTLPCLAALLAATPAGAWQTYPDDQDPQSPFYVTGPNYSWVTFDYRYGQGADHQYKGVWRIPNAWPGAGASVDINIGHIVHLSNIPYVPASGAQPVAPFGGGNGQLALNGVNIQEGAAIVSSLDLLSFDGGSTWSGGYITGKLHNMGDVVIAAPSTVGRGGEFRNSNRISIPTTLTLEFGLNSLRNESSGLPNAPYAEIALTQPNATINVNGGGGGAPIINNYGVIRKTGGGTAYINDVALNNYAAAAFTRSGTIQVDSGTLVNQAGTTNYYGLKAEIAPGAVLQLSGPNHRMNPGVTTVTGGGILRLPPDCILYDPASTGAAMLAAPEGKLECAGGEMRNLVNTGSINVTADSVWRGMVNLGHVRQINSRVILGGVTNGSATNSSAVWDLEDTAGFAAQTVPPTVYNHAHVRKSGPGTSMFTSTSLVNYGSATDPNAGRIEVTGGVLRFPDQLHFNNGGSIRVASGTTMEMAHTVYFDNDGTLTLTGSGKVRLLPGASFYAGNATVTGTLNAAPGTFDCTGGSMHGPLNNTGEITVTAPTSWSYGFLGSNTITNSGTIHLLATSAGSGNSLSISNLVGMVCTPASVLSFDVAGRPAQKTQWARLLFGAQNYWTIGGTLRINFGSFTPVSGDRWRVINYQSGFNPPDGAFAALEFANVPPGFVPALEKVGSGSNFGYEVVLTAAPAPQTYAQWAAAQSFATAPDAAFTADPDKDGWSNGLECALGTNPKSAAAKPAGNVIRYNSGGDLFLGVQYTRPGGANRPTDVQYIAERSDELGTWTTSGVLLESGPLDAQGNETITLRLADPFDYHARGYLRLRVQQ